MLKNAKEKLDAIRKLLFGSEDSGNVGLSGDEGQESAPQPESSFTQNPAELIQAPPAIVNVPADNKEPEPLPASLQALLEKIEARVQALEEAEKKDAKTLTAHEHAFSKALSLMEELAAAPAERPAERRKSAFASQTEPAERARQIAQALKKLNRSNP